MSGGSGYGGWSDDYDEERYVDGDTLRVMAGDTKMQNLQTVLWGQTV